MDINYIWVGEYEANLTTATDGPICMARSIYHSYNINFWCLDKYSDKFRDYFKRNAVNNINVLGIESYVSRINNSLWMYQYEQKWAINYVEFFINQIASKANGSCSYKRDIANAKNLISLFLLYYKGGYIVDTSIYPTHLRVQDEIKSLKSPKFIKTSDLFDKGNTIPVNHEMFLENCRTSDVIKLIDDCDFIFTDLESRYMYSPKHHEISWFYLECFLKSLSGVYECLNYINQSYPSSHLSEYKSIA
jgi:hypothetical protein